MLSTADTICVVAILAAVNVMLLIQYVSHPRRSEQCYENVERLMY